MPEYLKEIDDATLRSSILQVIRTMVQRPKFAYLDRRQVVNQALLILAKDPRTFWGPADISGVEANLDKSYMLCEKPDTRLSRDVVGEHPDNQRIESVLWDLIARGLVYPRLANARLSAQRIPPMVIDSLYLTPLGERYFKSADFFHPSGPDFIPTAIAHANDLPDDVKTLLEEAQACFMNRLLRSAVIMLGLAYEAMAAHVFDVVVGTKRPREAKDILEKIESSLRQQGDENGVRAVRIANEIRADRNKAAHEWSFDFDDVGRVENLLVIGGRNIAAFWGLASKP